MYKTLEETLPQEKINGYWSYQGPFKKALDIANHYGFHIVPPPPALGTLKKPTEKTAQWYISQEEKKSALEYYKKNLNGWSNPYKVCYTYGSKRKIGHVKLEIFGSSKSIAEALLLRVALAILNDHGHKSLRIDINSRGCKESSLHFVEDFKNYYRKNANNIPDCCQTTLRTNVFEVLACENNVCKRIKESAPRSIAYLNEDDRTHFKEVIEYIETMNVPYSINSSLIGEEASHARTFFQIKSQIKEKESAIVARGERYDYAGESVGIRVPVVGISLDLLSGKSETYKPVAPEKVRLPHIYFVHLGSEAKRESLPLLEELRRRNVRVLESLMKDSLWQQMRHAESLNVPYVVIMGLQEVKERSVIVRNMTTQAQVSVSFTELSGYLKNLR